ncbi:ECF transporter S component [Clostridium sp. DL1XJH146]
MKKKNGILKKFNIFEIIVIALMAALGLATKPIIVPLTHMITGPLFIPGGAVAGGFYMLWIVLGAGLIPKRGTATLIALTQAIIVAVTGTFGTHGVLSIVTYTLPGLMIDFIFLLLRRKITTSIDFFLAGVIANLSGTYLSNLVFFKLPLIPLVLSLATGTLSGGLGGIIGYVLAKKIKSMDIEGIG